LKLCDLLANAVVVHTLRIIVACLRLGPRGS